MRLLHRTTGALVAAGLLLGICRPAAADQLRLHYVPGPDGTGRLETAGPGGPAGERVALFGAIREPNPYPLRANYLVTFRQAYTGQLITVPVAFPEGTPQIAYVRNRVLYNYGSYTIQAVSNPDGSLDLLYNSGFLRPLYPNR